MAPDLPLLRPRTPADLQQAREKIPWVDDDDLRDLERKSAPGTAALGFMTWGGGHLYLGEVLKGGGLLAGLVAWLSVGDFLPYGLGTLGYLLAGSVSAVLCWRKTRALNRFVAVRNEVLLAHGPDPAGLRLLAAAAAVDPTALSELERAQKYLPHRATTEPAQPPPMKYPELTERLRKLAALRAARVIDENEYGERKVDLLAAHPPATRPELDDLLFELLPLVNEAILSAEDLEFVKRIGSAK